MQRRAYLVFKRWLDLLLGGAALIVLSPLLAGIALSILVIDGGPVLFRQVRPGRHGRPFVLIKFRTMRAPHPWEPAVGSDPQRVTRLGRFLRRTSLDELPELWNVLRGEMSLVGPRPLLMAYLASYTPEERRRHEVRPGLTGWAAVNGRQSLRFEDRLALDVWYVDHLSLQLDLRIIAMTISQVLRRTGATEIQNLAEIDLPDRFRAGLQAGPEPTQPEG